MRYLKQALAMMREERLFSGIYIVGTALAIAFTMVMAVVYYIKLAPIYPEPNRARTVYFEGMRIEAESGGVGQTGFSAKAFEGGGNGKSGRALPYFRSAREGRLRGCDTE